MVQLLILGFRRDCLHLKDYHRLGILPARRLDLPTLIVSFGAKHQTCPHLAVHVPPDSTLEMGAAEMGAAIRCPVVGDSPRGTVTDEPLTSTPEPWSSPSSCF